MREPLSPRNEQGFVLVMAMIIVAIVSIAGFAISSDLQSLVRIGKNVKTEVIFDGINQKIQAAVYNDEVWAHLQSDLNACRTTGLLCQAGLNRPLGIPLDLVDTQGEMINQTVSPTAGYTSRGEPCSSFSPAGNDDCPARFEVRWVPVNCIGSSCDIEITSTLIYQTSTPNLMKLNPRNYSFRLIRGRESGSLREACVSLGGSFEQARNFCELDAWTQACPPGHYLVQAYSLGTATCRPLLGYGANCPAGSAAIGIASDGSLDCRSTLDWR